MLHLNSYFQRITKCCRILCEVKDQMENSAQARKNRKHILQERRKASHTQNQHLPNGKNDYKPPNWGVHMLIITNWNISSIIAEKRKRISTSHPDFIYDSTTLHT